MPLKKLLIAASLLIMGSVSTVAASDKKCKSAQTIRMAVWQEGVSPNMQEIAPFAVHLRTLSNDTSCYKVEPVFFEQVSLAYLGMLSGDVDVHTNISAVSHFKKGEEYPVVLLPLLKKPAYGYGGTFEHRSASDFANSQFLVSRCTQLPGDSNYDSTRPPTSPSWPYLLGRHMVKEAMPDHEVMCHENTEIPDNPGNRVDVLATKQWSSGRIRLLCSQPEDLPAFTGLPIGRFGHICPNNNKQVTVAVGPEDLPVLPVGTLIVEGNRYQSDPEFAQAVQWFAREVWQETQRMISDPDYLTSAVRLVAAAYPKSPIGKIVKGERVPENVRTAREITLPKECLSESDYKLAASFYEFEAAGVEFDIQCSE